MTKRMARVWRYLDERLGLGVFRYDVPRHANTLPYALGGAALTGFVILIATGIVMTQYYHPDPAQANASVRSIAASPFLGLVRGIHYWTAQLTIAVVALHLTRVFLAAAYKRPREMQWVVGVLLLGLTAAFFFTGTVIKWDQEGYEALQHNDETANLLARGGVWFAPQYLDPSHVMVRLYSLHVSIFPLALAVLVTLHLLLVKRLKISPRPNEPETVQTEPVEHFTRHLRKIALLGGILLFLAILLAVLLPASLGPEPIPGIEVTKPPWPFLWLYGVENVLGIAWLFPATVLAFVLLLALPFVDRNPSRHPRDRRVILSAFILMAALLLGLAMSAALMPGGQHL